MLDKFWYLRRYIVAEVFIVMTIFQAVNYFTSTYFLQSPFTRMFSLEGIFEFILFMFVYMYVRDVLVKSVYGTETTYLYNEVQTYGILLFGFFIILSRYSQFMFNVKYPMTFFFMVAAFLVAPFFWIRLIVEFILWIFSFIFRTALSFAVINDMVEKDNRRELSIWEAFVMFDLLDDFNSSAAYTPDLSLAIEEPNIERVRYIANRDELIENLNNKWSKIANGLLISISILIAGNNLYNFGGYLFAGYAAADRKPSFSISQMDDKNAQWILFASTDNKRKNFYYDNSSVSIDDKTGIATVLFKETTDKDVNLSRLVIRYNEPNSEAVIMDYTHNGKFVPKDKKPFKIEKKSSYAFLLEKLSKDLDIKKKDYNGTEIESFIDSYVNVKRPSENNGSSKTEAKKNTTNGKKTEIAFPNLPVERISQDYDIYFASDEIAVVDEQFKFLRLIKFEEEIRRNLKIKILSTKEIKADGYVTAKKNFRAALPDSTVKNSKVVLIKRGERYKLIQERFPRYFIQVKDDQGKNVVVPAHLGNIEISQDQLWVKYTYRTKEEQSEGWINSQYLVAVKK